MAVFSVLALATCQSEETETQADVTRSDTRNIKDICSQDGQEADTPETTPADTFTTPADGVHSDGEPDTQADAVDVMSVELDWGLCDTNWWPTGYPGPAVGVECTIVQVPLDHADPSSEKISLRIGRQRSMTYPSGKAVFHLAGGPGGASVVQSGIIPVVLADLLLEFDQVYIDQRGTGGSERMDCSAGYPETGEDWIGCAGEFEHTDLNHFLTVDAAHDIEHVRLLLGYERIYLRGGSYGTRLGLEYLRQHEGSVVAAVLDGLAPPDLDLLGERIKSFDHGVALLIADCEQSTACQTVSPTLEADLWTRRELLQKQPQPITVDGLDHVEDEQLFLMLLEGFLYGAHFRFHVPRAIHEAVGGDPTLWYQMASDLTGSDIQGATTAMPTPPWRFPLSWRHRWPVLADDDTPYVAAGLFITIMCAEWFPNSGGLAALQSIAEHQRWGDDSTVGLAEACAAWEVDSIDETRRQPVASEAPVLLMSGAIDLNTWHEWGTHTAATLPNGTHLVVPYASHSTLYVECAAQIMSEFFLAAGDMAEVDTSCLNAIAEPVW